MESIGNAKSERNKGHVDRGGGEKREIEKLVQYVSYNHTLLAAVTTTATAATKKIAFIIIIIRLEKFSIENVITQRGLITVIRN